MVEIATTFMAVPLYMHLNQNAIYFRRFLLLKIDKKKVLFTQNDFFKKKGLEKFLFSKLNDMPI